MGPGGIGHTLLGGSLPGYKGSILHFYILHCKILLTAKEALIACHPLTPGSAVRINLSCEVDIIINIHRH